MTNTTKLLTRTLNKVPELKKNKYDLIVVGAGPGGIMTAFIYATKFPNKKILILEQASSTFESYKESGYEDVYNWFKASNDPNYLYNLQSVNGINLILGQGPGGGSLHFGLQYIDQKILVDEYDPSFNESFINLYRILRPDKYNYGSDNELLSNSYKELYNKLNESKDFNVFNNKVYSTNLTTGKRLLYADLLNNLPNVKIQYNVNIKDLVKKNGSIVGVRDYENNSYNAENYALCSGSIQNPGILLRSGIESGNNLKDHVAVNFVFIKSQNEEITKIDSLFNEDEIEELDFYNVDEGGDFDLSTSNWNNENKMHVIFRFKKKLTKSEIEDMKQGKRVSVDLERGTGGYPYVYNMGSYWLGNFFTHPGGSLRRFLVSNKYDFTNLLLGKHGGNFSYRVMSRPGVKLVGVVGKKTREIKSSISDNLGFSPEKTINHLQTRAKDFSWQTYISFIPPSPELLILTCATSKFLGNGKITLNEDKLNIDLGYDQINHDYNPNQCILNAYEENYKILKTMGYIPIVQQNIDEEYIKNNRTSIYHYMGTCAENIERGNKVKGLDNLYIGDISIATKPWLGSTSTLAAVYGMKCGENIGSLNIKYEKYKINEDSFYEFKKDNNKYGFSIYRIKKDEKENIFYDFEPINKNSFLIKKSFPDKTFENTLIEISNDRLLLKLNNITKEYIQL
jgi:hypothetical protein